MSESRVWWIDPQPCDEDMPNTFDAFRFHPGQGPLQWQARLVYVIEYSAYEAAKADREDFKMKLAKLHVYAVEKEKQLAAEQARSAKLIKALKNYAANDEREKGRCPAREAIKEYEESK